MDSSARFNPLLVLFIGIISVSSASILIRFTQTEASSVVIAAYRMGISAILLVPWAFLKKKKELLSMNCRQIILVMSAGVLLSLHFLSWITSLEFTSVASSVILVTTAPLWVAIFSPLFLKEKVSTSLGMGLGVALLGGVIVGLSHGCVLSGTGLACTFRSTTGAGNALWGNFLALVGALFSAGYLMIGRRARQGISLLSYITLVYASSAVVLSFFVAITRQRVIGYSLNVYLALVAVAIIPQLLGHTSFNWALKYIPAAFVSVALLGEPLGSSLLALFLLNERPGLLEIIGGIFILTGIFLATRSTSRDNA